AVTRDHLGAPNEAPRPLAAAIEQWLHLGRRTWINLSGREIHGIATARELSAKTAWEIDTLIDAPEADEHVLGDLLRQAALAAREALATHLILRTPLGSPAAAQAPRAGFRPVVEERLWMGHLDVRPAEEWTVREAEDRDTQARFQVYSRTLPVAAREAIAMTVEEWEAVQDYRWVERGGVTLVAEAGGRVVASARCTRGGQFTLAAEQDAPGAVEALLAAVAEHQEGVEDQFALVAAGTPAEDALRRAGLTPAGEFALFCLRLAHPVRDEAFARASVPITG
ncbi:MAG: hypothetical protein WD058_03410, partial [Dehalococcoidia bacterium]